MNDRAATKFVDPDFISITDYMNTHSMFFDLGGHLGRCTRDEFRELDARGTYTGHVANAVAAYVAVMPSCSITKLAGQLRPYDTLWNGFTEGFRLGLEERVRNGTEARHGDAELAKLVVGVRKFPELEQALSNHFTLHGLTAQVKGISTDPEEGSVHAVSLQRGNGDPSIYAVHNEVARRMNGGELINPSERELQRRTLVVFPPREIP